jgi:FlaG/FlaF family flagellin (archaellin)
MKGVSAVIAIILILMIVVALAALAYTWFTGIFTSLTETTGTAVESTTGAMATQFTIEAATCEAGGCGGNDCVHVTIRNTGSTDIDGDAIAAYVDDVLVTSTATGNIAPQAVSPFDAGTAAGDVTCGTSSSLRVTSGTGLAKSISI